MSRSPVVRFSAFAVLVLALLGVAGCGRRAVPTAVSGLEATGAPLSGFTQGPNGPLVAGQAIVSLQAGVVDTAFLSQNHLEEVDRVTINGRTWLLVNSPGEPLKTDLAQVLALDADVQAAVANSYYEMPEFYGDPMAEDDPYGDPMAEDDGDGFRTASDYMNQSAVAQIDVVRASRYATGAGVKVAILDNGIDSSHPAFANALIEIGRDHSVSPPGPQGSSVETQDGIDFDGDGLKDESFGHGTHIAGIVHLAAPGAELVVIKVLNDDGWGTSWGVIGGIREAIAEQANVINLSLGFQEPDPFVHDAVVEARSHNVVVVASAGNRASNVPQYPAAWDEVISVAAVDNHDQLADFASWHPSVDLTAPGVDIVSAIPQAAHIGDYALADGASMATAWVSAGAALVLDAAGPINPDAVALRLADGSVNIDWLNPGRSGQIGSGRLNLLYSAYVEDEIGWKP